MRKNHLDVGDLEGPTRVWIVDDDPSVAFFMQKAIHRLRSDLKVEILEDGYDALLQAGLNPPDLMILDVGLPGMSGKEVFRSLKNNRKTRQMRILAISGDPDEADQMQTLGADAVLPKPFRVEQLLEVLNRFLVVTDDDADDADDLGEIDEGEEDRV